MRSSFLKHAGIGAATMLVMGLVPFGAVFAPLVGGAMAGWLGGRDATHGGKLGGAAGAIASLAVAAVVFLGVLLSGFDLGITLVLLGAALFATALLVGFGALGGVLGSAMAADRRSASVSDAERGGARERDPVREVQERYAAGELTESELEDELDRVLEGEGERGSAGRAERTGGTSDDRSRIEPDRGIRESER
ncbi:MULTISPECIES: DUF5518 domain-containing protein [Haloferacaceae]|uniref:DUF5518 domain-containing protein n=1 Tax=Halorubrum glutamatedens TaxID=2707018 RepID=A0ABD5QNW5_9EURY|nr:DUF5518 domain-containing protein [Halobellus captivus]